MIHISKNYFSLISGGARGRFRKTQKGLKGLLADEESFLSYVKGLTIEEAHERLPFFSEKELGLMFKFDTESHIIATRLSNNNLSALIHESRDRDMILHKR